MEEGIGTRIGESALAQFNLAEMMTEGKRSFGGDRFGRSIFPSSRSIVEHEACALNLQYRGRSRSGQIGGN